VWHQHGSFRRAASLFTVLYLVFFLFLLVDAAAFYTAYDFIADISSWDTSQTTTMFTSA
jgi:surface protein